MFNIGRWTSITSLIGTSQWAHFTKSSLAIRTVTLTLTSTRLKRLHSRKSSRNSKSSFIVQTTYYVSLTQNETVYTSCFWYNFCLLKISLSTTLYLLVYVR